MNKRPPKQSIPLSGKKLLAFKAIAILLPVILLLVAEAGLRLSGYGHDLRLFVPVETDPSSLVMNPYASERYFTSKENATKGVYEPFKKKKTNGTFRIFVLGESTTLGFPYMASASFDRWLYYRLMHTFPEKEIEIINVSLTAVNSYTVLGFSKEVAGYDPDAVMIYCGQNEYYGALGVGSTSRLGGNRTLIRVVLYLRTYRLVQLMENGYQALRHMLGGKQVDTRETLMKRMAANQEIPIHSALYNRGIEQFRNNMNEVCKGLSQRKIPVFVSNLVSNVKDQKPFVSSRKDSIVSAGSYYRLAEKAYHKGDFATARQFYLLAKDWDMLRFRAPEVLNTIIAGLPDNYPGVYLVDTKKIFEDHSPGGIIGNETILEHVHPNLYGYCLMSEAFYQSLKQHSLITPDRKQEMTLEQLRREMPITIVDSLKGTFEIRVLKEKWPFNEPRIIDLNKQETFEAKLAIALLYEKITWVGAMGKQLDYYTSINDRRNMLKVAEASVLQITGNPSFLLNVGKLCAEQGQPEKAKVYLLHAFRLSSLPETAQRLVILFLKDDQPEKALPYLDYLEKTNASGSIYSSTISLIHTIIDSKLKLRDDAANVGLLNRIAQGYYAMQNTGVALQYATKAYALDKKNSETLQLIHKIKALPPLPLN